MPLLQRHRQRRVELRPRLGVVPGRTCMRLLDASPLADPSGSEVPWVQADGTRAWRVVVGVWPISPADDLRDIPDLPDLGRFDSTGDQDLVAAWVVGLRDHGRGFGSRDLDLFGCIVPDQDRLVIGKAKVHADDRSLAAAFELSQPLVGREVVRQHGHGIHARNP